MNSSRDLSTSSHQCQSKTVKDSKDSELKAKVEATVRSPAGADEQFYDRNFVTAVRAMTEFLLKPEHLVGLRVTTRRSSTTTSSGTNDPPINVYWRKDIEARTGRRTVLRQ